MKTLNAPVGLDPDQEADLFEFGDLGTPDYSMVLMTPEELKNFLYHVADVVFNWCTEKDGPLTPMKINNQEYFRVSELLKVMEQLNSRLGKKD